MLKFKMVECSRTFWKQKKKDQRDNNLYNLIV